MTGVKVKPLSNEPDIICRLCRLPLVLTKGSRLNPTSTHDANIHDILVASLENNVPLTHRGQIDYIYAGVSPKLETNTSGEILVVSNPLAEAVHNGINLTIGSPIPKEVEDGPVHD
jgi:hypothetical protein